MFRNNRVFVSKQKKIVKIQKNCKNLKPDLKKSSAEARGSRCTINDGGINNTNPTVDEREMIVEEVLKEKLWWTEMVPKECENDLEMSRKFYLLEKILNHCEKIGDKL